MRMDSLLMRLVPLKEELACSLFGLPTGCDLVTDLTVSDPGLVIGDCKLVTVAW